MLDFLFMENSENKENNQNTSSLSCAEFIEMAKKEAMHKKLERINTAFEHFKKIFPQIERKGEGLNVHFKICGYVFYIDRILEGEMILLGRHWGHEYMPEITDLKSFGEYILWYEKYFPKKPEVKFKMPAPQPLNEAHNAKGGPWWKFWE
jgi:hypothetical protein